MAPLPPCISPKFLPWSLSWLCMREGGEVGIRVLYRMGWDAWNKRKEVTSKRVIGLLCLLHYFYSEKCNRRHIRCLPLPLYFFAPVTLLPCSCYSPS